MYSFPANTIYFFTIVGVAQPTTPQPQQSYQKEFSQTFETTEQRSYGSQSMFQKTQQQQQQQQTTERIGYANGVHANGHSVVHEVRTIYKHY